MRLASPLRASSTPGGFGQYAGRFQGKNRSSEIRAVWQKQSCFRGRFTMSSIAISTTEVKSVCLDIETVAFSPLLSSEWKWAIRFNTDGTMTIVLGMRNYGRGWFSAYFAGLVAARLGIPFRLVHIYYRASLPAALQTPMPSSTMPGRCEIGPIATAVGEIIEHMCDQVIDKGRLAFASIAGVDSFDVRFDQSTGRFLSVDFDRSDTVIELARSIRGA